MRALFLFLSRCYTWISFISRNKLSHAPLEQNGCSTTNTSTESNKTISSEPFRIGIQYASSSFLRCLAKGQPTAFVRIWQYALCFAFWKAQSFIGFILSHTAVLALTYSERRCFTASTFIQPSFDFAIFLGYYYSFSFIISERTAACYIGRYG